MLTRRNAGRRRAKGVQLAGASRRRRVLTSADVNLEDVAAAIRDRLDALGPFARAELLRVLLLPDYERAGVIGE